MYYIFCTYQSQNRHFILRLFISAVLYYLAVSTCLQVNTNELDLKVKLVWLLYWYAALTCQNAC
jgi:hypothetical protein